MLLLLVLLTAAALLLLLVFVLLIFLLLVLLTSTALLLLVFVLLTTLLLVFLLLIAPTLLLIFFLLVTPTLLLILLLLLTALLLLVFFLIFLVVFLLLLFELFEQFLDPLLVFFCLGVVGTRLERRVVFGDGVFPVGDFLFFVFLSLALAEKRITEVELGGRAQCGLLGEHGARKIFGGLAVILEPVSRRPRIHLQIGRVGLHAKTLLESAARRLIVALLVSGQSGRRGPSRTGSEEPASQPQGRTPAALADQGLQGEQHNGCTQWPLVTLDGPARGTRTHFDLLHLPDPIGHQTARRILVERHIKSSGDLGDFRHA